MSGRAQAFLALVLAGGLHVSAFALYPPSLGAASSGAGGESLLTLQAADGALADLVAEWDRPPAALHVSEPQGFKAPEPAPPPEIPSIAPQEIALPDMPRIEALPLPVQPEPVVAVEPPPPVPKPPVKPRPRPEAKPAARPAAAPAPQSVAPARKAAGSGDGAAAGEGAEAQAATRSKAQQVDLERRWGAKIHARIARQFSYPRAAGGAEGTAMLRVTVEATGQLAGVLIVRSSGNDAIDAAAVKAVKSARRFPAAPPGVAGQSFLVPISGKN